jgi:hypothetical protein
MIVAAGNVGTKEYNKGIEKEHVTAVTNGEGGGVKKKGGLIDQALPVAIRC